MYAEADGAATDITNPEGTGPGGRATSQAKKAGVLPSV